jgi:RNA polymerase sigma-70 factor, ECF subfamily
LRTGRRLGAIDKVMDDDGLIAALAAGDDTALREMFTRHAPWLATRLVAALPLPNVEDLLQETFLVVWKARAYQAAREGVRAA